MELEYNQRECKFCNKIIILKTGTKENNKTKILVVDLNRKFCSTKCQIEWQRTVSWEERVGKEVADNIRINVSERLKGDKNPSKNPEVALKISEGVKKFLKENPRINEKNGFFRKKHTEEYKKLAKESRKGITSYNNDGYEKLLQNIPKGEKHPNWNNGSSFEPYSKKFNKLLKIKIKTIDNFSCRICNKNTQKLAIHHIDYDKKNSEDINLISLCISCHSKTNFNRQYWQNLFDNMIKPDNLSDK